jgi:hypothetical protein
MLSDFCAETEEFRKRKYKNKDKKRKPEEFTFFMHFNIDMYP